MHGSWQADAHGKAKVLECLLAEPCNIACLVLCVCMCVCVCVRGGVCVCICVLLQGNGANGHEGFVSRFFQAFTTAARFVEF